MKPRIASYYESRLHRNDGNPLYVTNCLRRDFPQFEFHHMLPDPKLQLSAIGKFDLHLWIDWGEDALVGMLPYEPIVCPKPNIYWASDTHLGWDYRVKKAREFDHVFVAQKAAVVPMKLALGHSRVTWLPHAADPAVYNPGATYSNNPTNWDVQRIKQWDCGFVGHVNDQARLDMLDRMFVDFPNSRYGNLSTGRVFEKAADLYTKSRVVWNSAIKEDVNMRVFEVLATRTALVTQMVPDLFELFPHDALMAWADLDTASFCTRRLLRDDDLRMTMAQKGYDAVLAQHTIRHRVETMLTVAGML